MLHLILFGKLYFSHCLLCQYIRLIFQDVVSPLSSVPNTLAHLAWNSPRSHTYKTHNIFSPLIYDQQLAVGKVLQFPGFLNDASTHMHPEYAICLPIIFFISCIYYHLKSWHANVSICTHGRSIYIRCCLHNCPTDRRRARFQIKGSHKLANI